MSKVDRKAHQEHIGMNNGRGLLSMDEQDVDGNCVRTYRNRQSRRVVAFNINFDEYWIGA
jgi:hypothetical protein